MEFFVFMASALAAWALVVGFRAERRATRLEGIVEELQKELRFVRRSLTPSPKAAPAAAAVAESPPVAPSAAGPEEAAGTSQVPPPLPVRPAAIARPAAAETPPTP